MGGRAGRAGITALVWDPFKGRSTDNSTRDELAELMGGFDDDVLLAEQVSLLDHLLGELGCTKAGVIGWCLGGRFALLLGARDRRLASVTAYHPTTPSELKPQHTYDAIAEAASITAPVLVVYPGSDAAVSVADFEALQTSLQGRPTGATITQFYPGAEHGFTDRSRQDKQVNADAYKLSWPPGLSFIKRQCLSGSARGEVRESGGGGSARLGRLQCRRRWAVGLVPRTRLKATDRAKAFA